MKRIRLTALVLTLLTALMLLCGCAGGEAVAAEDEFILAVDIESEDDVYRVVQEYSLGGTLLGGSSMNNANGQPIDDTVYFRFVAQDFPEDCTSFKNFTFMIMLSDTTEEEDIYSDAAHVGLAETNECRPFSPEFGNIYRYKVTGSFSEGFSLEECE